MAVNWGDYEFDSIKSLNNWDPPTYGGIYAITFIKDPENKPNTHTILYFGETENFAERGISKTHHKYTCWKHHAYQKSLYVSIHRVYSDDVRKSREEKLISHYNPDCNKD